MSEDRLTEKVVDNKTVFEGIILSIEHMEVMLPNGKRAAREVARHKGASAIVPVDDMGNVYLVKQYRAPLGKILLEIPAGKLDSPDEDRLEAAKRELGEETGLTAESWTHLGDIATSPGFCTEIISLYLARGLNAGGAHPDEDEFLNVVRLPFHEAVRLVKSGGIPDGKSVCAILLASDYINAGEAKENQFAQYKA